MDTARLQRGNRLLDLAELVEQGALAAAEPAADLRQRARLATALVGLRMLYDVIHAEVLDRS